MKHALQSNAPLAGVQPCRVTVLGATGSIGQNTLNLIEQTPERFDVVALTSNANADKLADAAKKFKPQMVAIADESAYPALKEALAGTSIRAEAGKQGIIEAATLASDCVISAIVGAAGLQPTLAAIERGARVGLANKECLVAAGAQVTAAVKRSNATLIPVDSEHSAIFQVLETKQPDAIESITITASGGPFRTFSKEQMERVTPQQAVAHPNWSMGAKISVDSATMMNKGLELIEAYHLFPLAVERFKIVVHPESIIHGLVSYTDGSTLAQMGCPDMRTPIAYALGWPQRLATPVKRLDLAELGKLTFEAPDETRFPALHIARDAFKQGGAATAIMNAANEVAVEAFLAGKLAFPGIMHIVEQTLAKLAGTPAHSLEDVLAADAAARAHASTFITQ